MPLERLEALHPTITYREIATEAELWQQFKLREEVFSAEYGLPPTPGGLDMDAYDLRSRHLGAFIVDGGKSRLVGACRMVFYSQPSPFHAQILERLSARGIKEPCPGWQIGDLFDLDRVVSELGVRPQSVVEFSRTTCHRDYRGLDIGVGLVAGIYALARLHGALEGLGGATPKVLEFYKRFGCLPVSVPPAWMERRGTQVYLLKVPLRALPSDLDAATARMERDFRMYGAHVATRPVHVT
ncbi:MAG: GNAT family N-acetyltransferase [Candidatus Xenobia bacterium]